MGKYEDLQLLQPLETLNILDRIMANHDAFQVLYFLPVLGKQPLIEAIFIFRNRQSETQ